MFDERPPPILRGDLFTLLDPDGTGREATLVKIAEAAQRLVTRVKTGSRTAGAPVVMQCLEELASLSDSQDPMRAFWALTSVRQRLVALGHATTRTLPFPLETERILILPQSGPARVARVMKAGGARDIWFVATREASNVLEPERPDLEKLPIPRMNDSACGPIARPTIEATFKLFRFGERASDMRMVMRVVQEAGAYCDIQAASDGERVALLSRDVIGVFDPEGQAELSGRLPIDANVDNGAEVTAMALSGNILGLNIRQARESPVELALIAIKERKGFPVGKVGEDASRLLLGERAAYVIDGVHLVRLPLFQAATESEAKVFPLRPWFAEYPWAPSFQLAWDGKRVWLGNGRKIVILDSALDTVLAEIILPEPAIELAISGETLHLVHWDETFGRLRIGRYSLDV